MGLSLTFWGTRGSIPTPGPGTVRYGGNTACLTVTDDRGDRIILDAGTGIRAVGRSIAAARSAAPDDVSILLTHTHWDHIQGLPFFLPSFRPGDTVRIVGPAQPGRPLAAIIDAQMDPAVFPVPVRALEARIEVTEIRSPEVSIGRFRIGTVAACHPGATLGYSICSDGGDPALIYLTDNELRGFAEPAHRTALVRFLRQTETLVHDGMYFEHELRDREGWGHSSAADAVRVALDAGCRRLILFHHDPSHDDVALERLLEEAVEVRDRGRGNCEILLAAEGMTLRL